VIKYRTFRCADHVVRVENARGGFNILTGKLAGKRPLGRTMHRWQDHIRTDLKEIGIITTNWVDSVQDRDYCRALVNGGLKLRVP
jgi:hypothetical protein